MSRLLPRRRSNPEDDIAREPPADIRPSFRSTGETPMILQAQRQAVVKGPSRAPKDEQGSACAFHRAKFILGFGKYPEPVLFGSTQSQTNFLFTT